MDGDPSSAASAGGGNSGDKLEMKERNYFQMIEVLMTRLKKMEEKVDERRRACADDQNADSDFCSSMVGSMQQDLNEIMEAPGAHGGKSGQPRYSLFGPRHVTPEAGGDPGATLGATSSHVPEINVTFRSQPATDFGKRLEQKFEVELGGFKPMGGGAKNKNAGGISKNRRMGQRKLDEKKQARVKYEKKLLANLENFVTRSVNDHAYVLPSDLKALLAGGAGSSLGGGGSGGGGRSVGRSVGSGGGSVGGADNDGLAMSPLGMDAPAPRLDVNAAPTAGAGDASFPPSPNSFYSGGGFGNNNGNDGLSVGDASSSQVTRASHASYATSTGSTLLEDEEWPIQIGAEEFNPKLLLSLACERIVLPSGERMFKHFVLGQKSCWLFVYLYWFVHCKFFQEDSEREQEHLLECVSTIYVQILSLRALEAHKDFFFKYYPFVIANAIHGGFYYLCPGSRHLYSRPFRRILYLQCAQILTGVGVCPVSVQVQRAKLFPDEAADEVSELANSDAGPVGELEDGLPPLPQSNKPNRATAAQAAAQAAQEEAAAAEEAARQAAEEAAMEKAAMRSPGPSPSNRRGGGGGGGGKGYPKGKGSPGKRRAPSRDQATLARSRSAPGGSFDLAGGAGGEDIAEDAAEEGGLLATRRMGSDANLLDGDNGEQQQRAGTGKSRSKSRGATPGTAGSSSQSRNGDNHLLATEGLSVEDAERLLGTGAPLRAYTGRRDELRFNPQIPATLVRALPRQQRVKFDAAGISPFLQQYLEHPTASLVGRRPERMGRTTPVRWCLTGGSETFRRMENRKQIHDDLSEQHKRMKEEYRQANLKEHRDTVKALQNIEKQKKRVYKGGAVSVGRYSLDLVAEISQRSKEGALKRMEREKKRDQEREDLEKERKKKELEERKKKKQARSAAAN